MGTLTRAEWAAVLDRFGNGTDASLSRVADDLLARGDAPLALRVAELGLLRYGSSDALRGARSGPWPCSSSATIRSTRSGFIIYSQWADAVLPASGGSPVKREEPRDFARLMASECLAVRVRRLGRVVTRVYDAALAPHGVTIAQLNLLTAIVAADGARPTDWSVSSTWRSPP